MSKKEFFRKGHLYLLDGDCICEVTRVRGVRGRLHVDLKTLARKGPTGFYGLMVDTPFKGGAYCSYNLKGTVEEITLKDIPLYLSWRYVSPELLSQFK